MEFTQVPFLFQQDKYQEIRVSSFKIWIHCRIYKPHQLHGENHRCITELRIQEPTRVSKNGFIECGCQF
jgi:hypothetical protein